MPPTIVRSLQFHSSTQYLYILVCPQKTLGGAENQAVIFGVPYAANFMAAC